MEKKVYESYLEILREELVPALGCMSRNFVPTMGCFFGLAFKKYGMPLPAIIIGEASKQDVS